MSARGYLFEGSLYMQAIVGNTVMPAVGPLEGTRFSIKTNVNRQDMVSRGRGSFGQILESVGTAAPADFAVTLAEGSPDVMALGLMGSVAALTQASGTLAAETVIAKLGKWVFLSKANFTSAALTVTNTGATTTYVEGTDYLVNRQMGWIKALADGDIAADEALKVSGAYAAISGTSINGATATDLRVRFTLDGRNQADGADCKVTVYEAIIAPDQAVDLLSGQFVTTSLTGRMKTPAGFLSPFKVDLHEVL